MKRSERSVDAFEIDRVAVSNTHMIVQTFSLIKLSNFCSLSYWHLIVS